MADPNERPVLSVIVCTYNRAQYIIRNLESLEAQTGISADQYEVILVNNNSPDKTEELCLNYKKEHPLFPLHYFLEMNQGHTYARNRGIAEASGSLLAFIDDDAFVRPDYCQQIISFFEKHPEADMIGGRIYPIYEDGEEPKWMTSYLLPLVVALDKGDDVQEYARDKFPTGANMAFRKTVFDKSGWFNTDLGRRGKGLEGGDEKEMALRAKKSGFRAFYAPFVIVDHIIPANRVSMDYIKGLAVGVGRHERTRLALEGSSALIRKWIQEFVKIGGTLFLFLLYVLKGQWSKGWILVKFRYWVFTGLSGWAP
ncbi:MAG: glycosyltransferase [Owenweeksia sp.]